MNDQELEKAVKENQSLFSRRLQKSKIKDLERDLRVAQQSHKPGDHKNMDKLRESLFKAKKDVFTDERKIE